MRVLFISSGNTFNVNPKIKNQSESLKKYSIEVTHFLVRGKGFKGYIKNIPKLRKYIKTHKFDIIHAHYSFSGFIAYLAGAKPLVVSLMGTDIQTTFFWKAMIKIFYQFIWEETIVKSKRMKKKMSLSKAIIISNGVDLIKFATINKKTAYNKINFKKKMKHIIFVAYSHVYEKNYETAKKAYTLLDKKNIEFHVVDSVDHSLIPYYMYAADVLLLTSFSEGSPNVIKEAMACNLPIVSTNVGDVKEVIGNTEGCFISSYETKEIAEKIKLALDFGKRTTGRNRIKYLQLDEDSIAKKIIELYKKILVNI